MDDADPWAEALPVRASPHSTKPPSSPLRSSSTGRPTRETEDEADVADTAGGEDKDATPNENGTAASGRVIPEDKHDDDDDDAATARPASPPTSTPTDPAPPSPPSAPSPRAQSPPAPSDTPVPAPASTIPLADVYDDPDSAFDSPARTPVPDEPFASPKSPSPTSPAKSPSQISPAESSSPTVPGPGATSDPDADGFDDFDDFDAPGPSTGTFDDDGFGDFGDFEEGDGGFEAEPGTAAPPAVFIYSPESAGMVQAQQPPPAPAVERWSALSLRPVPPRSELASRLEAVLAPLVADPDAFTDEEPRAVGGLAQILTSESSRDAYAQLTTAPVLKPLDWTRSRVRRDHLVAMGVPVNLDEVDSHRLSALPPLRITTEFARPAPPRRAASADPETMAGRPKPRSRMSFPPAQPDSFPMTDSARNPEGRHALGARPDVDTARAEELCGLDEDQLKLMPLSRLEEIHKSLAHASADASALLAWFLQLKDAQTQDSATYNGMIAELIANAAKVKQGSAAGGVFRRSSTRSRPSSMSGGGTPRRVGSPAIF